MKVKELIEILKTMPQDSLVELVIPGDIYIATARRIRVNQREDGYVELFSPYEEDEE